MTTYHLSLTSTERSPGGPVDSSAISRILASLTSEEPSTVAATLRAAADQLDPPKPPRPIFRASGPTVDISAPGERMDRPDMPLSPRAAERVRRAGRTVETDLDRASRVDGCGPEHTYKAPCAYASKPVSD